MFSFKKVSYCPFPYPVNEKVTTGLSDIVIKHKYRLSVYSAMPFIPSKSNTQNNLYTNREGCSMSAKYITISVRVVQAFYPGTTANILLQNKAFMSYKKSKSEHKNKESV